jgi:putative ABC transport system permease protein
MLVLTLVRKSLRNRLLASSLTFASIALSVALLVGIENVRSGMRQSFSNTISRTDLIVGPRGGSLQLLLYSVFGIGAPSNNISWSSYEALSRHPAVAWTIPISLGDSHRGFRVVGTDSSFYEHFRYGEARPLRFAEGSAARESRDVVMGAQVAAALGYATGSHVVITHGLHGTGIMDHDEHPFTVTGVLERTFTPVDRSLYVTLQGIEALHEGFLADPFGGSPREEPHAGAEPGQITAFFLGARSRIATLQLQREINTFEDEPLTAIVPGIALAEMWRGIGYAEDALLLVTFFVVAVGLIGMLIALYSSLEARRREMAILRAVGAGAPRIVTLLVLESGLLGLAGALGGVALVYALLAALKGFVESNFGLHLPIAPPTTTAWFYVAAVVVASFLIGVIPAIKAYRNSLADGLTVRI